MNEARENPEHPDWFVSDDEDYIRDHINAHGFTIVSEAPDGQIAGFFVVKYPESSDHLGKYLHYTDEELARTAIMDSAAVAGAYRGHHLQRRMLQTAEADIDRARYTRLLCTVHPDNVYSLSNMQSQGYEVRAEVTCYGGRRRYVLEKRLDV
jgi:ribosomal protein S18 acetylase RimI-like enzyme